MICVQSSCHLSGKAYVDGGLGRLGNVEHLLDSLKVAHLEKFKIYSVSSRSQFHPTVELTCPNRAYQCGSIQFVNFQGGYNSEIL